MLQRTGRGSILGATGLMHSEPIFLDHHSTTPCDVRVIERMTPFLSDHFGNPASMTHQQGQYAARAVEDARRTIAGILGVEPREIVFTSGATEANNLALRGVVKAGDHLITDAIEHASVLAPAELLSRHGVEVSVVETDTQGFIDPDRILEVLRPNTRVVSVMAANGEIGTIEPVARIGEICRDRKVLFHTDATQAIGKIPVDVTGVDLASMSGHKIYGPKGIGALYIRRGVRVEPLIVGGGQERGLRSGTVNVPGVVGLAAALEIRAGEMREEAERLTALRDHLRDRLVAENAGVSVNGPPAIRLPGNLNVSFAHVDAESLILAMRRFSLSSGSACSSSERGPSHVLRAIGVEDRLALGSIRIGLGRSTTRAEVDLLADDLARCLARLRRGIA